MSLPNNQINTNFTRPAKALLEQFKGVPVANIGDAMNRMACLSSRIFPLNNAPLLGSALTVKTRAGDILYIHKAIDIAQPGDVLVIDGQGDLNYAIMGELMANLARNKGIAGVVIDGSIRDANALRAFTDFPVYCAGITPNGPSRVGGGEVGTSISCGGQCVQSGDIVVGDEDGVVVISPLQAEEVLSLAKTNMAREQEIYERLMRGESWDRPWVDDAFK